MQNIKSRSWLVLVGMALSGCSAVDLGKVDIARLPIKIARVLADPIMDFTVADAKTTLSWVEQEEKSGSLSPAVAEQARLCPSAVIKLHDFVEKIEGATAPAGAKGLIYYATVKKFSGGGKIEEQIKALALQTMTACAPLVDLGPAIGKMG